MDLWILALIPIGGFSAWQLYRQYKISGKVSKFILAQLSAFLVVYLVLDLLERRGLVTGRTMDYLSMGVVALFVIIGSALTGAAVRKAEERKKKLAAGKTPLKKQPARNKSKTATAKKSAPKSKKKKG